MGALKAYDVVFSGLKQGTHHLEFQVDDALFRYFDNEDVNEADIKVHLTLHKRSAHLEFEMKHEGSVQVNCDVSNEPFRQAVEGELKLIVKFGEDFNFDNDDVAIIPHGEHKFNIAQYLYEMVVLSLPTKNYHPGLEDGSLKTDMIDRLESYSSVEPEEEEKEIDPRWSKLKDLLTDNK